MIDEPEVKQVDENSEYKAAYSRIDISTVNSR